MSDRINDGGPAFPLMRENSFSKKYEGMTLRDYFAGQALAGAMATVGDLEVVRWDWVARDCYLAADAMIAARAGGQSDE